MAVDVSVKTRALWTGVHRLPLHCDYVVHLDDDTHFNDNMVFDESLFRANTVAVAFIRKSYTSNNCERFVDFWYVKPSEMFCFFTNLFVFIDYFVSGANVFNNAVP